MSDRLHDLTQRLRRFADERDWHGLHTPKNLAMALAAEVGELVELFQWLTGPESVEVMEGERAADVEDELADVFIYLLRLADVLDVDLTEVAWRKIVINEGRFPTRS